MKRIFHTLFRWSLLGIGVGVLATATGAPGSAKEDPLDVVAILVRDQHWDRAATALTELDAAKLDPVRFHTLRGMVRAHDGAHADAAVDFGAAIDAARIRDAEPEPVLFLHLAQALLGDERPSEAMSALASAPRDVPATFLLEARAAWQLRDHARSWQALEEGAARFPEQLDFPRQQVLSLVELGLFQESSERGAAMLERSDARPEDVLSISEAMRRAGALDRAEIALTVGRWRFPDALELWVQSGAVALARGRPEDAGDFLAVAAELDPAYTDEAAECFRKAGRYERALALNAAVGDPRVKAKQRLGILLETEQWESALALQPRIERLSMLSDSSVAYGLAYARFMVRDWHGAERLLQQVTDPGVFQSAAELRLAMAGCQEESASCP